MGLAKGWKVLGFLDEEQHAVVLSIGLKVGFLVHSLVFSRVSFLEFSQESMMVLGEEFL
jgi:hypothetical protein